MDNAAYVRSSDATTSALLPGGIPLLLYRKGVGRIRLGRNRQAVGFTRFVDGRSLASGAIQGQSFLYNSSEAGAGVPSQRLLWGVSLEAHLVFRSGGGGPRRTASSIRSTHRSTSSSTSCSQILITCQPCSSSASRDFMSRSLFLLILSFQY